MPRQRAVFRERVELRPMPFVCLTFCWLGCIIICETMNAFTIRIVGPSALPPHAQPSVIPLIVDDSGDSIPSIACIAVRPLDPRFFYPALEERRLGILGAYMRDC